ncbi:transporter [Corynebacterium macginleyi]|uniref:Copper chaperone n=1 Tax=Corynebacterium macginleyi TaxID=38290 RepID=A0A3M0GLY4_9CORY|nr:heavy-metal-associated domain-containing protein [Corynebacterium macginleyi]MBK4136992.1 transporter [Corynebacterium macginleyi]MBK4140862.1 transporter [Corynebacterium macginleyi]MBK4142053.1 transporter [Corynebacterium macginleyi]MBK4143144.1 transporter [Corynebacterium macginleyi]MBK4148010.1 transporter [Corynebacterium macginleyi]
MATRNYTVEGMSCEHCEMSIREEVGQIAGVDTVSADHTTGAVSVSGSDFTDAQVAKAIAEAGYTLK